MIWYGNNNNDHWNNKWASAKQANELDGKENEWKRKTTSVVQKSNVEIIAFYPHHFHSSLYDRMFFLYCYYDYFYWCYVSFLFILCVYSHLSCFVRLHFSILSACILFHSFLFLPLFFIFPQQIGEFAA